MLPELLQKSSLFHLLYHIDIDLAKKIQLEGCPFCDGPLHHANYPRQPRGEMCNLPKEYLICFSFCCGKKGCRRRTKPPSCRFMGQRVYWAPAILIVMTLKQNRPDSENARKLIETLEISRQTLKRWTENYREVFPKCPLGQRLREGVSPSVRNNEAPSGLVNYFQPCLHLPEQGLIECLKLLALGEKALLKMAKIFTHKMDIFSPDFV